MEIVTDYSSLYGSTGVDVATGIFGGIMIVFGIMSIISLAITVILMIAQWKIFAKNNRPGWYSLIPILNVWTLFEIVGIQGWWSLIPFANIVYMYIANYKLPLQMGKSKTLAILNIFFPYVVYPMLAFAKDKNVQGNVNYQQPQYGQPMPSQAPVQPQYGQSMPNQAPVQPQYGQPMPSQAPVQPQYGQSMPNQAPVQPQMAQPQPVNPTGTRCPNCNTELTPGTTFCPGCGRKQD